MSVEEAKKLLDNMSVTWCYVPERMTPDCKTFQIMILNSFENLDKAKEFTKAIEVLCNQ